MKTNHFAQIFQNTFSTIVIKQLIALQEKYEDSKADIPCGLEKKTGQQGASDGHHYPSGEMSQGCDGESNPVQAKRDLEVLLRQMKRQIKSHTSYVSYKLLDNGDFYDCKLDFQGDTDFKEDMFAMVCITLCVL